MRVVAFLDGETTGLHPGRVPWEIGLITRTPAADPYDLPVDIERHWFIHAADLRWYERDDTALTIGRFWARHPHAGYLGNGGYPSGAPDLPDVVRLGEAVAQFVTLTRHRPVLVGSNPAFDTQYLEREALALGLTPGWHYHPDDVPAMIRGWLRGRGRPVPDTWRSDDLCRAIGIDPARYARHTALGDCRMFRDAYDVIEQPPAPCTSFAAVGCPACGECRCTDGTWRCDPACTLHAPWSPHGAHDRDQVQGRGRNESGLYGCARGA